MLRRITAVLAALACQTGAAWAEPPHRVASANLCADQLLMALAAPDQIASLSPLARDASISFLADRARGWPANRASGEDLVRASPDLVLTGPYDSRYTRQLLDMQHIATMVLAPWSSLAMGRAQVRSLAAVLGHPERGEKLVAQIDAAMQRLPHLAGPARSFVALHRRGFVAHAGLVSEILVHAGLRDTAANFGVGAYGFVRLETLVRHPPDYLVMDEGQVEPQDNGQAFLVHPALRALFPRVRRLVAPGRLTICGGPSTPALVEALGREISEKVLSPER